MSAVIDITSRNTARATVGDQASCITCRRHRSSGDVLYCSEPRSNAVGGVAVVDVGAAKHAGQYERMAREMAHRCKYYQEER